MHPLTLRLRGVLAVGLSICVATAWFALAARPDARSQEFYFHHDHILGTSLDVWLNAHDEAVAENVESAILGEIERLRLVFSLYDESSELSRLNRTHAPTRVSADLLEVLRLYEHWQARANGAFNGQLGRLVEVWKDAEKTQREPDPATLSQIVAELQQPGWHIDPATQTVTRLTEQPLNLNAIAKGYIIQKAAAAALAKVPSLEGLLLNLGGDISARAVGFIPTESDAPRAVGFIPTESVQASPGSSVGMNPPARGALRGVSWTIGVQNPHEPHDNAEPIAVLRLANRAIATSGGYERYYTVLGKRHSHIFDPRTGQSADGTAGSTVIAADNVTANALATTLCVLSPEEGLKLVAATPGAECLIVTKAGKHLRSPGFAMLECPASPLEPVAFVQNAEKKDAAWPADYQVNLTVTLPPATGQKYRRPYLAAWVENADGKPVRTISVWGNSPKWIKELPQWWKFAKNDAALVKAVSRATRTPGKYSLVWDGKDDKGVALPQGTYAIFVEVHREHGKLVRQTGKLDCLAAPAQLTLEKNAETGDTLVEYAKKKAP